MKRLRRRASSGFTMFELLVTIGVVMLVTLTLGALLNWLVRAAARTSRGSVELQLAARLAEEFRSDVRQASSFTLAADGKAVTLQDASGPVRYFANGDGRLVRSATGTETIGPLLRDLKFSAGPARPNLLCARWRCAAEAPPESAASEAGSLLVLDTALRAPESVKERAP